MKLSAALICAVAALLVACSSEPPPAPIPEPPPAPLDEAKVLELSTDIHVTDVFGDEAVGTGADGELWLMNIRTGDSRQLTTDGHRKWGAVLSDDHVAWIDQRRMVQLTGYSSPIFSSDVYVRNRHTGEEQRITDAPATGDAASASPVPAWSGRTIAKGCWKTAAGTSTSMRTTWNATWRSRWR